MTNPLAEAAMLSGLISEDALAEAKRWNPGLEIPDGALTEPKSLEEAAGTIRDVLEGRGLVLTKETDLSVLQQYLNTQKMGELHVESDVDTAADFPVSFGKTTLGDFILPYRGDDIRDLLLNGKSYLKTEVEGFASLHYFKDVREVFFGDVKAFLVCTLSMVDVVVPPSLTEGSDG